MAGVPDPADYAELARYVSAEALRGLNFRVPAVGLTGREVAEQVYGDLAQMRIGRVVDAGRSGPVTSGAAQQMRTPRDIQLTGAATTLDACVMFAALVRNADLAPVLAVGRDLERDDLHAIVLVVLDHDDSIGSAVPRYTGIATADGLTVARIATGSLIAVDVAGALTWEHHPETELFDAALSRGEAFVQSMIGWGEPLHLVNVRARERLADFRPHAPSPDPTFLPMSLPAHAGHTALFAEQRCAVDELRRGSGTMVLLGPAGSGKTTAALHLASEQMDGPAWFLDASSPDSLVSSLADIAFRENGRSIDQLDNLDRRGYAAALLARANQSTNPWCIVLDNADDEPAAVLPLLPRPSNHGQTVVITTTNSAWLDMPVVCAHVRLGSVGDAEAELMLADHKDLVGLADGRVLVLEAYARYLAAGHSADGLRRHSDEAPGEQRGIVALVGAIVDDRPDLRDELGRLSLLPADHLPRGHRDDDLAAYGLIDLDPVTRMPRMHRLIAGGIHHVLGESDLSQIAFRITMNQEDWKVLSVAADPGLLNTIGALLLEHPPMDHGPALAAAARLMELRGRIELSQRLAQQAVIALDGPEELLPVEYADALQGLARYVNQHRTESREAIETAVDQVRLAQRIAGRYDDRERLGRARRLEALLRIKLARLEPDPGQRVSEIRDALAELERAADEDATREGDPAEASRALFNLAGAYVELAQLVPDSAADLLHRAAQVYEQVRDVRLKLYRQQLHPHIAACIAGLALVRYLEALLVPRTALEQQALLAEASQYGTQALEDRFSLDGPLGGADTGKSARLLTKIAYARHILNESHPSGDVLAEATRETAALRRGGSPNADGR